MPWNSHPTKTSRARGHNDRSGTRWSFLCSCSTEQLVSGAGPPSKKLRERRRRHSAATLRLQDGRNIRSVMILTDSRELAGVLVAVVQLRLFRGGQHTKSPA